MKEPNFEYVASRILKEQAKLGKLKRLSVKVADVSESQRRKLITAGALGVTLLSAGVLALWAKNKDIKFNFKSKPTIDLRGGVEEKPARKPFQYKNYVPDIDPAKQMQASLDKLDRELDSIKGSQKPNTNPQIPKVKPKPTEEPKDKTKRITWEELAAEAKRQLRDAENLGKTLKKKASTNKNDKILETNARLLKEIKERQANIDRMLRRESWEPVEESLFQPKPKKKTIYIEATYEHGTKMFEVFSAEPEVIKTSNLDRQILKEVSTQVSRLKNREWTVKEEVTLSEEVLYRMNDQLLDTFFS